MKKNYRRKVWTVNANDVEWVECEHINKTGTIIQLETNINGFTYQLKLAKKRIKHKNKRLKLTSKS